jgi:hypothetical protein
VAVKEALETIAGHGLDADQPSAMGKEAACFADMNGGNLNLRDESSSAELGDLDQGDEMYDAVVEIPGIGCGFDGDDVGREEMVAGSIRPFFEGDFSGMEDDVLERVDGCDVEEVFMQINAEKPNNT